MRGEEYLTKPEQYTAANRRAIRKAEKSDVKFKALVWWAWKKDFCNLYTETMQRLGTTKYYFFPPEFFASHYTHLKEFEQVHLFGAFLGNQLIAGALCLSYGPLFHYHFGCSSGEYLKLRPNNVLFDGIIRFARVHGFKKFHLGGGYEEGDSLFRFKAGFSPLRAQFYVAKRIHLPEEYERLTREHDDGKELTERERNFFPAYRR